MVDELLKFFGIAGIAASVLGGLAAFAYSLFQSFGTKWLDARFDERLQTLKHEHGKEVEQLRFQIATMLDRTVKLHQREFDVLPEAWAKLNEAFWPVRSFVHPGQIYPDLNRKNEVQLEEFFAASRLSESQKEEIRETRDKTSLYIKQIFWHDLHAAKSKASEAYRYVLKHGIFIRGDIRERFAALHDLMWSAIIERELNEEHGFPHEREKINRLVNEGEAALKELETIVHERLWTVDNQPSRPGS